jgi:lipopolysaccharide biosynthesis glycosyltransferase
MADSGFFHGLDVMLWSFLRHNPRFEGDILVLDGGLAGRHRKLLESRYGARFVAPDPRVADAADSIAGRNPAFAKKKKGFCGLQAYQPRDYDRVVWIDADILCAGDCRELFDTAAPLAACPDVQYYRRETRHPETFRQIPIAEEQPGEEWRRLCFNAGVVSVGREHLTGATYDAMLASVPSIPWEAMRHNTLTDQRIANEFFRGNYARLGAAYNFQPWQERLIWLDEQADIFDARLIHFSWTWKPWAVFRASDLARDAPCYLKHFELWHEAFARMQRERGGARDADEARYHDGETRAQITFLFRQGGATRPPSASGATAAAAVPPESISLQKRLRKEQERSLRLAAKLEAARAEIHALKSVPGLIRKACRTLRGRNLPRPPSFPVRNIHLFAMIKDEEDLLADWLRYHLALLGPGRIHVLDDGSTDRSREILESFGGAIFVEPVRGNLPFPERKAHAMNAAMGAFRREADFLLPMDADEFLAAWNGGTPACDLLDVMAAFGRIDPAAAGRFKFARVLHGLLGDEDPRDPLLDIRKFRPVGPYPADAPIDLRKCFFSSRHFVATDGGNHNGKTDHPATAETDLCIFHFPWRSREQARMKVRKFAGAYRGWETGVKDGSHAKAGWQALEAGNFDEFLEGQIRWLSEGATSYPVFSRAIRSLRASKRGHPAPGG